MLCSLFCESAESVCVTATDNETVVADEAMSPEDKATANMSSKGDQAKALAAANMSSKGDQAKALAAAGMSSKGDQAKALAAAGMSPDGDQAKALAAANPVQRAPGTAPAAQAKAKRTNGSTPNKVPAPSLFLSVLVSCCDGRH